LKYSIDTSAILDAWRRHYPRDVFPALWVRFEGAIASGALRATEEVLVELERKDDEVYDWAKQQADFFVPLDEEIQQAVSEILLTHERLLDTRANRSAADPFVIALAQLTHCAVVTGERRTGSIDRRLCELPGRHAEPN
jgi:hypothetical protein